VRLPVQAYNGSTVTVEVQPGGNEQGIFLLEHAEEISVERIGSDGNRDGFVAGRLAFDQLRMLFQGGVVSTSSQAGRTANISFAVNYRNIPI